MRRPIENLLIPLLAWIALATPAFAQTDVTPVVNQLIDWAALALMAGGGVLVAFVLKWVKSKTKMQDNEFEALLAARLNDILHRSIEHAVVVAKNEVNKPGSGLKEVKLDNFFLNVALQYAVKSMPEIIEYFNLTKERIEEMIIARLDAWVDAVPADGGSSTIEKVATKAALSPAA